MKAIIRSLFPFLFSIPAVRRWHGGKFFRVNGLMFGPHLRWFPADTAGAFAEWWIDGHPIHKLMESSIEAAKAGQLAESRRMFNAILADRDRAEEHGRMLAAGIREWMSSQGLQRGTGSVLDEALTRYEAQH